MSTRPDTRDWRAEAACAGMDPALFFPRRGDAAGMKAAKAVCARCPVRDACAAEHVGEDEGVWGGMSMRQRREVRRQRRRVA